MIEFGYYVQSKRGSKTQEHLASDLAEYAACFGELGAVSISRWESNLTRPSLGRIIKIISFFGDSPSDILPQLTYPALSKAEDIVSSVAKKISFSPSGIQLGTFPVTTNHVISNLNISYDDELAELLLDFDHSIFDTDSPVTNPILRHWASRDSNLCFVCSLKGQYVGHLVALRVKPDAFKLLIDGELEESLLSDSGFATYKEPHCLYIYSIYGANKIVASYFLIELVRQIFLSGGNCNLVGGLCATRDGYTLAKKMGLSDAAFGSSSRNGTIYYKGTKVDWVTCSGSIADVFLSVGEKVLSGVQLSISSPENLSSNYKDENDELS